jgi:hypothetical protein
VIPAVGIVPIPFELFRRDKNIFSVLPALGVDVAVGVLDLRRIAIRVVATTNVRTIRHMPRRIEFLVQRHILWRMVPRNVILVILRPRGHYQDAAQTDSEDEFA